MKRVGPGIASVLFFLSLLLARGGAARSIVMPAHAQAAQSPQLQRRPTESSQLPQQGSNAAVHESQIALDAVVTDSQGRPLTGLRAEDFQLYDNKQAVVIDRVSEMTNGDHPDADSQVMLVVDAINASRESVARTADQVRSYLRMNGGSLPQPLSILILSDSKPTIRNRSGDSSKAATTAISDRQAFFRRIPPSRDGLTLVKEMDQNLPGLSRISDAQGAEGDTEKAQLSIRALDAIGTSESRVPGHKVVIWISPGAARLARSSAKTNAAMFSDIVYFSDLLRDARITLDLVNPDGVSGSFATDQPLIETQRLTGLTHDARVPTGGTGPTWYEAYYSPVKTAKQADINDLALQVLAHQSGGLVLTRNNQIAQLIARCINDAGAGYVLSFAPAKGGGAATYHALELRVRKPAAKVRVREGYYGN